MLFFGDLEHIRKLLSLWLFRQALSDRVMLDLEAMFDWQQSPSFVISYAAFAFKKQQ